MKAATGPGTVTAVGVARSCADAVEAKLVSCPPKKTASSGVISRKCPVTVTDTVWPMTGAVGHGLVEQAMATSVGATDHEAAPGLVGGPAHDPVVFLVGRRAGRVRDERGRVLGRFESGFAGGIVDADLRVEQPTEIQRRSDEEQEDRQDQGKLDDRLALRARRATTRRPGGRGWTHCSAPGDRFHRFGSPFDGVRGLLYEHLPLGTFHGRLKRCAAA